MEKKQKQMNVMKVDGDQKYFLTKKTISTTSPYSSLSSWLDDLESFLHPSAEDIALLSPVGRKRSPSNSFHTTSTPVSLAIQPMNTVDKMIKEQEMVVDNVGSSQNAHRRIRTGMKKKITLFRDTLE